MLFNYMDFNMEISVIQAQRDPAHVDPVEVRYGFGKGDASILMKDDEVTSENYFTKSSWPHNRSLVKILRARILRCF